MPEIQEVLNRRSDLSTFVVHLTRGVEDRAPWNNLVSIIGDRRLRAGQPMGWAMGIGDVELSEADKASQRVVCFSETPLEHAYSLFADIENRQVHLSGFGLAFTKMVARRAGVNPVWYVDMSRTANGVDFAHSVVIRSALNDLVRRAALSGNFRADPIAKVTPFMEGMQTWRDGEQWRRREFWWEREWRHLGDLDLTPIFDKIIWLCPEDHFEHFEAIVGRRCIDPSWSLEQIVARLSGLEADDMTPFWTH